MLKVLLLCQCGSNPRRDWLPACSPLSEGGCIPYHTAWYGFLVEKLDRSSWFRVAARLLVERGGGGLRVEALCRDAGVTKGSFYHHFRDLGEFKTAFMDYLYQRGAMDPMSRLEALDSPRERLRGLIEAIACEDLALEAAVRRWAASDPAVAEHLRQVDQARTAFVAEMYHELLPDDPALADDMCRLAQAFYLGAVMLEPPVTGEEYRRLTALLDRIVRV